VLGGRHNFAGAAIALLVNAIVATASAANAAGPSAQEAQIMAAFLYNFTKFVEWPADRFSNAAEPIVLGVFGESFITEELAAVVDGRKVNGRRIVVRRVVTLAEVRQVHVVFVAATQESRFATMRPAMLEAGVLTVGESAAFLDEGGAIRFVLDRERLRFEINMSAAQRAHLKISSQLQKLAAAIRKDH